VDLETPACALRLPPRVGKDGDAGLHAGVGVDKRAGFDGALDDNDFPDAGELLDLGEVGGFDLAAEDGAFVDHGDEHVGESEIDSEYWLAGDDVAGVDTN